MGRLPLRRHTSAEPKVNPAAMGKPLGKKPLHEKVSAAEGLFGLYGSVTFVLVLVLACLYFRMFHTAGAETQQLLDQADALAWNMEEV